MWDGPAIICISLWNNPEFRHGSGVEIVKKQEQEKSKKR